MTLSFREVWHVREWTWCMVLKHNAWSCWRGIQVFAYRTIACLFVKQSESDSAMRVPFMRGHSRWWSKRVLSYLIYWSFYLNIKAYLISQHKSIMSSLNVTRRSSQRDGLSLWMVLFKPQFHGNALCNELIKSIRTDVESLSDQISRFTIKFNIKNEIADTMLVSIL